MPSPDQGSAAPPLPVPVGNGIGAKPYLLPRLETVVWGTIKPSKFGEPSKKVFPSQGGKVAGLQVLALTLSYAPGSKAEGTVEQNT